MMRMGGWRATRCLGFCYPLDSTTSRPVGLGEERMFWIFLAGLACLIGIGVGIGLMGSRGAEAGPDGKPYPPEVVAAASRSSQRTGLALLMIFGIGLIGVFGWYSSHNSRDQVAAREEARAISRCEDVGMAYVMSQDFVKRQLKAPSTAVFPRREVSHAYLGDCRHAIDGAFDAQNSFGAMIRSTYSVTMIYQPDSRSWRAKNLTIQ